MKKRTTARQSRREGRTSTSRSTSWIVDPKLSKSRHTNDLADFEKRKGVLVRVPVSTWRRLSHVATDHDKSLQALLEEGIEYVLMTYE